MTAVQEKTQSAPSGERKLTLTLIQAAQRIGHCRHLLGPVADQDEVAASAGKGPGHGAAEVAGGAGDETDAIPGIRPNYRSFADHSRRR